MKLQCPVGWMDGWIPYKGEKLSVTASRNMGRAKQAHAEMPRGEGEGSFFFTS